MTETPTLETHLVHQAVVIPIDRLVDLDSLFADTGRDFHFEKEGTAEVIRKRLGEYLPGYFDDTLVNAYDGIGSFPTMHYVIPLERGRVQVELVIAHHLGQHLSTWIHGPLGETNTAERRDIAAKVHGKGGIVISGQYHLGKDVSEGVYIGRDDHGVEAWAYAAMLNSVCEDRALERNDLGVYQKGPISYYDNSEVTVRMREFSLARLRQADQVISEFMLWLRDEQKTVRSIGEVVRAAALGYARSDGLREMESNGTIHAFPAKEVENSAAGLLAFAQGQLAHLSPPENDHMNYLVPSK